MAFENNMAEDMSGELKEFGDRSLRLILQSMVKTIESSKSQIFDVYDAAHNEVEASKKNLAEIVKQTKEVINEVDALEKQEQEEKQRLVRVSSSFSDYSEERIQKAYEAVKNVQVQLGIARGREKQLRKQRNELEIRLAHMQKTVLMAERLASRISSMLNYLGSQIIDVVSHLEAVSKDRFLSASVIRAQEDERLRVSREMHDGPAQSISALMLEASAIEKLIDLDPDGAKMNIQQLRRNLKSCLKEIRQIMFDMRPMSLDDLGLVGAIDQLINQFNERYAFSVGLSVDGKETELPQYVKTGIFRIVQESLNNVRLHSGVQKATVRILFTQAAISVLVEDEGKGFDSEAYTATNTEENEEGHYGFIGMKERSIIIGSQLVVTSKPGQGTKVHLRLPLTPPEAETLGDIKAKAREAAEMARQYEKEATDVKNDVASMEEKNNAVV